MRTDVVPELCSDLEGHARYIFDRVPSSVPGRMYQVKLGLHTVSQQLEVEHVEMFRVCSSLAASWSVLFGQPQMLSGPPTSPGSPISAALDPTAAEESTGTGTAVASSAWDQRV